MTKIELTQSEQLTELKKHKDTVLVFKHSTRCPISKMALNRIESDETLQKKDVKYYYLDLLKHRDLSNEIAAEFAVEHQSPQVLLVRGGRCIFNVSHSAITAAKILEQL